MIGSGSDNYTAPAGGTKRIDAMLVIVLAQTALLMVATAVLVVPHINDAHAPSAFRIAVVSALMIIELATLFCLAGVRTISLHTLRECLRTKVATAFIIALVAALAVVGVLMKGDDTQAGRIKALLDYGPTVIAVLLGLVTIFLGASLVSSDVRNRQVFITMTKPIARWQYILGRWLGVVLLDVILLTVAMGAVYGVAQHFRFQTPRDTEDHRAVETEVFAARGRVVPAEIDIEERVKDRLRRLQQDKGKYQRLLGRFKGRAGVVTDADAANELIKTLKLQEKEATESTKPGRIMTWDFKGIEVAGKETIGKGEVAGVFSDPKSQYGIEGLQIEAAPALIARMLYRTPIRINDVQGYVAGVRKGKFAVEFFQDSRTDPRVASLKAGKKVSIIVDPAIQVRFKITGGSNEDLPATWVVENPDPDVLVLHREIRQDRARVPGTLTVSSRVVDPKTGETRVIFWNQSNSSIKISRKDISVLYPLGGFTWNFIRGGLLIAFQLMFLAAVAVAAGSFASFPIACMICFVLLPFSLARGFLMDATRMDIYMDDWTNAPWTAVARLLVIGMKTLLPDFAATSPVKALVDGMRIPWAFVGQTAALTVAVRAAVVLLIGCVVFSKRELARVQV